MLVVSVLFFDQFQSRTHFRLAVDDVHIQDSCALAGFNLPDLPFHPNQRTVRHMDFVSLYVTLRDVYDVIFGNKVIQKLFFVVVDRAVNVIYVQDHIESGKTFDIVCEFFNMVGVDKKYKRGEEQLYNAACAIEIMPNESIRNRDTGIQWRKKSFILIFSFFIKAWLCHLRGFQSARFSDFPYELVRDFAANLHLQLVQ